MPYCAYQLTSDNVGTMGKRVDFVVNLFRHDGIVSYVYLLYVCREQAAIRAG